MISENNKEIRITLSKNQANWLEKMCQKAKITKSQYISWIMAKKAEEMLKVLNFKDARDGMSDQELADFIKELDELKSAGR